MMKSANLLHRCGLGDSDMNSNVELMSCSLKPVKLMLTTPQCQTFKLFKESFSLIDAKCHIVSITNWTLMWLRRKSKPKLNEVLTSRNWRAKVYFKYILLKLKLHPPRNLLSIIRHENKSFLKLFFLVFTRWHFA